MIVTLFVNPKQFNNPEDLAKYPRTEETDAALLAPEGVDLLFAPDAALVYPPGFATRVTVAHLPDVLCGAHRPGHFDGVATVVTKLLTMTGADHAFFGEKDWQQLQIIRRLVTDLNIPTQISGCPTLREQDGLAMSSRNARLSPSARQSAPALHRALETAARATRSGQPMDEALAEARAQPAQERVFPDRISGIPQRRRPRPRHPALPPPHPPFRRRLAWRRAADRQYRGLTPPRRANMRCRISQPMRNHQPNAIVGKRTNSAGPAIAALRLRSDSSTACNRVRSEFTGSNHETLHHRPFRPPIDGGLQGKVRMAAEDHCHG